MPYAKRRTYNRRYYKKPKRQYKKPTVSVTTSQYPRAVSKGGPSLYQSATNFINNAYKGYSTAAKAYKLGSMALGMLNSERKYYDISSTTIGPSTPTAGATLISPFDSITTGDGPNNRDGSQIRVKSLQFKMYMSRNSGVSSPQRIKWVLFLDKRVQVGSTPSWTDLYDGTELAISFVNIEDQWKRFKILRQGNHVLSTENLEQEVDLYMPMSIPVRYDTSNRVIMNRIHLMVASDDGISPPVFTYRYRVRFYDN